MTQTMSDIDRYSEKVKLMKFDRDNCIVMEMIKENKNDDAFKVQL
jgi:hypothetical protein